MDLKMELEEFQPYDEQEKQDIKVILRYLDVFDDLYVRDNELAHITSSCWILNSSLDKVLMIYHNIYDSWGWCGGHADGDQDLMAVAIREAQEETGIEHLVGVIDTFFAVDILPVWHHVKRGQFISSHQHMNVTYLFIGDEKEELRMKPDENSGVKWIDVKDMDKVVKEADMLPIYHKLMDKAKILYGKKAHEK